ncbi:hypothetical protein [Salinimicrobium sp. TH3]|uniref:hypothetical protein n=1 Tax=Salinimicrobium sp. TH3 TaxID=2997342 RepID=UPI0022734933|nr:hypothetical protein [Salinimicrobium sp. TH3]MCY2685746.1 hypothetical protein [Salinimicrobium sp. TH3]
MSKKRKVIWISAGVIGMILLLFLANLYVKSRIEQRLESKVGASDYKDLSVNIFLNKFTVEDLKLDRARFAGNVDKISVSGISYYKFLFKNEVEIDELELNSPQVSLFPKDTSAEKDSAKQKVHIKNFRIEDGSFSKKSADTAAASFYAHIPTAQVKNVKAGMQLSEIKFYDVEMDTIYLKMNSEHYIDVGNFSAVNGEVKISDFKIRSFYPRSEFIQKIPYEKDHITLDVNTITLDSLNLGMRKDSIYLRNHEMIISGADLTIYRNKQVPDDPREKALYSKLLREAPLFLNFEKVLVENSEIVYEEQVEPEDGPAIVRFAAVNANINNLHNIRELKAQPKITANADFMRGTPVNIDWTFPVFDPQDKFQISGSFGRLEGEALDPFLVPSMNARARGTVNNVYFNFYGNDDILQGDYRMEYDNFKIELLTKEKEKEKGFLSSIANLFVDNKQEPDEGGGQDVRVERNKHRSFWNYAWKGLREGLIDAVGQL